MHDGCLLRLKSVSEAAGGTKVVITVEGTGSATIQQLRADAHLIQQQFFEYAKSPEFRKQVAKIMRDELPALAQPLMITGVAPGATVVVGGKHHSVVNQQAINDVDALRPLISEIAQRDGDVLGLSDRVQEFRQALETIQAQLAAKAPDRSIIREAMHTLRNVLEGAVGSTASALALAPLPTVEALRGLVLQLHSLARNLPWLR